MALRPISLGHFNSLEYRSWGQRGSSSLEGCAGGNLTSKAAKLKPPAHGGQSKGLGPRSPNGTKSYWLILVGMPMLFCSILTPKIAISKHVSTKFGTDLEYQSRADRPVVFLHEIPKLHLVLFFERPRFVLGSNKTHELPSLGLKDY